MKSKSMSLINYLLEQRKITLSTKITILRIILVPFIVITMIYSYWFISFFLILISAISDILDGVLARIRNETTLLGACLDPLADKLFIVSCYFALSYGCLPNYILPLWFTWLVFFKELFLIIGSIYFISLTKGSLNIKANWVGKIAMDVQTIFIIGIFINYFFNLHFENINKLIFNLVIILVLSSFFQYARIAINQVYQKNSF